MADQKGRVKRILKKLLELYSDRIPGSGSPDKFVDTLIAIVLSQNTTDKNSHRAYVRLRERWSTWETVSKQSANKISKEIAVAGLANQKSRAILGTLETINREWGSFSTTAFRSEEDDSLIEILTAIPGVGLKSVTCSMMFSLNRDLCAVDTHLHRVLNRLGVVNTSSPIKTYHVLKPLVPQGRARELHVTLIHFGREICKAKFPHCFECTLYRNCKWPEKLEHKRGERVGPKPASGSFIITDGI